MRPLLAQPDWCFDPCQHTEVKPAEGYATFVLGQIQHECRTAIRDLVQSHGREEARELVAMYLVEAMERRRG